jgi:hypothetical protein
MDMHTPLTIDEIIAAIKLQPIAFRRETAGSFIERLMLQLDYLKPVTLSDGDATAPGTISGRKL